MSRIPGLLLAVSIAFIPACGEDNVEAARANLERQARSFLPDDAANVRLAPGIPWVQIDFDVQRPPLEFGISSDRMLRAQEEGWTLCEQLTNDWTAFQDGRTGRWRQEKLYELYKDRVLITLLGVYESNSARDAVSKDTPAGEKTIQHVGVIASSSGENEVLARANTLNLSCDSLRN
jgi:hypothetical protein